MRSRTNIRGAKLGVHGTLTLTAATTPLSHSTTFRPISKLAKNKRCYDLRSPTGGERLASCTGLNVQDQHGDHHAVSTYAHTTCTMWPAHSRRFLAQECAEVPSSLLLLGRIGSSRGCSCSTIVTRGRDSVGGPRQHREFRLVGFIVICKS